MEGNGINTKLKAVEMAVQVVAAHLTRTPVPSDRIPDILGDAYAKIADLCGLGAAIHVTIETSVNVVDYIIPGEHQPPAIPIELSVKPDKLACLECGEWFRLLRPHVKQAHGMSDREYRARFGLTKRYPLVAPAYSKFRADFAREKGLGQR